MGIFNGPKDTRTKRQKLEAMANQTASPREAEVAKHLLFKKYGRSSSENTDVRYDLRGPTGRPHRKGEPVHVRPHLYEARAEGGSDILGCKHCGRSKNNPYAHHTFGVGA